MATAHLQNDWSSSVFATGGHDQLGRFRDNDDTFASFGANVVKRWGAFLGGVSVEHTHFYDGTFGETANIANDVIAVRALQLDAPARISRVTPGDRRDAADGRHFSAERYSYGVVARYRAAADRLLVVHRPAAHSRQQLSSASEAGRQRPDDVARGGR